MRVRIGVVVVDDAANEGEVEDSNEGEGDIEAGKVQEKDPEESSSQTRTCPARKYNGYRPASEGT